MENVYNDEQIISPKYMEQIAKEYYNHLKNKQPPQPPTEQKIEILTNNITYKQTLSLIAQTEQKIKALKKFCSTSFYKQKEQNILNVLSNINNLNVNLPIIERPQIKNFCQAVLTSIQDLSIAIKNCLNLLTLDLTPANKSHINNLILNILNIINNLTLLIGECTYMAK